MLNNPLAFSINPNSFYVYLSLYFHDLEKIQSTIVKKIITLKRQKFIDSKDLINELKTNPVIINSVIYHLKKTNVLKYNEFMNSNFSIYDIDFDKLGDCL